MACRFSLSSCGAQAPGRVGSVVCGVQALLLRRAGSVVAARVLSCPEACGILVPRPRIEPASPALEGGFFTIGPPGKSQRWLVFVRLIQPCICGRSHLAIIYYLLLLIIAGFDFAKDCCGVLFFRTLFLSGLGIGLILALLNHMFSVFCSSIF